MFRGHFRRQSIGVGRNFCPRHQGGGAIIEFVVGIPLIIFAVYVALSLAITLLSVRAVDLAARDAARAAALQQTQEKAMKAATAAVATHAFLGQVPVVDESTFVFKTYQSNPPVPIPAGSPGPHVTVTVKSIVKLPFKGMFYGAGFQTEQLDIARTYTFPILKLPRRPIVQQ